jgi:26S proteasome regulatory subunit N8
MFRKINSKERVVGFYSTGPQIRSNDLRIYSMIQRFLPEGTVTPPIFCIIDVRPGHQSIPTTAYTVVEEMESGSGKQAEVMKSFAHVPSLIGATEPEEIGVEHLLRDINDPTISTVANLIHAKMSALITLKTKLEEMEEYATKLADGKIKKRNHEIVSNMQQILNLLPNLNVEELVKAIMVKTNDTHMVIYLSSLIRSVIALHDLVNNKIRYNEEMDKTFGEMDGSASKKVASTGEEKKEEEKKPNEKK